MAKKKIKIYSDGGARGNPGPAAAAFLVIDNGKVLHKGSEFLGNNTNNFAEYTGVLIAFKWLLDNLKNEELSIDYYLDSELVVMQLSGRYKIKSNNIKPLIQKIKILENKLKMDIKYHYIPREKNKLADHLVNKKLNENC